VAGIWCTRKSITKWATSRYLRCCSWWYANGDQIEVTACISCWRYGPAIPMNSDSQAGGTANAPATCGVGACCRTFMSVQGRTRAPWKCTILAVQSVRKFHNVHRRWGQNWDQTSASRRSFIAWAEIRGAERYQEQQGYVPRWVERGMANASREQNSLSIACRCCWVPSPSKACSPQSSSRRTRGGPLFQHLDELWALVSRVPPFTKA
jgi:hypothetical protein